MRCEHRFDTAATEREAAVLFAGIDRWAVDDVCRCPMCASPHARRTARTDGLRPFTAADGTLCGEV